MSLGAPSFSAGLGTLALALGGLDVAWDELSAVTASASPAATFKQRLVQVSRVGVRHVQLDATLPAIRPRELDRSARRDLAAHLRREELRVAGLDVFIPPEHFIESATVDRAVAAVVGAIELAGDLAALAGGAVVARRVDGDARVSLLLPVGVSALVLGAIEKAAQNSGVLVADHALPPTVRDAASPLGIGIDAAACLGAGLDPAQQIAVAGSRLVGARLTDLSRHAGASPMGLRVVPGTSAGRLDVLSLRVALMTAGYRGPLVLDLRGVPPIAGGLAAVLKLAGAGL